MPLAKQDVIAAYRLFLAREPSDQEAEAWLNMPSLSVLSRRFMTSSEFQGRLKAAGFALSHPPVRLARDVAPISVQWQTDAASQARLLDEVTRARTELGRSRPHWSVVSMDDFLPENIQRNAAVFYASGGNDTAMLVAILARHGLAPQDLPRAVEYGCGVGRVTPHLAGHFHHVVGIDVSQSHLALAQEAVAQSGRQNVRLAAALAPDLGMTEAFDLWFSNTVLQHNPPPVIALVLQRMFALLAPGGVAVFQVPTYVPNYRFDVAHYLSEARSGDIEVHCLPQQVIFALAHHAGCVALEVREDAAMPYPWLSNTFVFRKTTA